MTGAASQHTWRHVVAGSSQVLGLIVSVAGIALDSVAIVWIGTIVLGAGIVVYAIDLVSVLRRATVRHRAPQAFLVCAALWLFTAFVLGAGTLRGLPWGAAFVYVTSIGWLGQIVNAHLHHIGVRLLATAMRGDDDETRPGELLSSRLSWTTFALFQIAVAAGATALLADRSDLLASAAAAGFAGWIAMVANGFYAARHASLMSRT